MQVATSTPIFDADHSTNILKFGTKNLEKMASKPKLATHLAEAYFLHKRVQRPETWSHVTLGAKLMLGFGETELLGFTLASMFVPDETITKLLDDIQL